MLAATYRDASGTEHAVEILERTPKSVTVRYVAPELRGMTFRATLRNVYGGRYVPVGSDAFSPCEVIIQDD